MSSLLAYLLPDPEQSAAARTLLVLAYAATAMCWLCANRRTRLTQNGAFSSWWLLGAVLLLLLAINKLFDLRRCFEDEIRAVAKAEGWYDRRQPMQFALAVVFPVVLAMLSGVFLATHARRFVRENRLALVGWVLLLLYLFLRQTQEWKPVLPWLEASRYYDWRFALEVSGILLVALAPFVAHPPKR